MSKRIYTRRQKEHALYVLSELRDYAAVSEMLGIPNSTLRSWWSEYANSAYGKWVSDYRPVKAPDADYFSPDIDAPTPEQIRDKLLKHVNRLLDTQPEDPRQVYYTSLAVRSLLDQIKTINASLGIQPPPDTPDTPPTP